jgi:hypothetical protein
MMVETAKPHPRWPIFIAQSSPPPVEASFFFKVKPHSLLCVQQQKMRKLFISLSLTHFRSICFKQKERERTGLGLYLCGIDSRWTFRLLGFVYIRDRKVLVQVQ